MAPSITDIPLSHFFILALPILPILATLYIWQLKPAKALYAFARMLIQLTAIGFVLTFLFTNQDIYLVLLVLTVMMIAATWISLNTLDKPSWQLYRAAFAAIVISGTITLGVVVAGVLQTDPWYNPRLLIPLAGMVYVVSMTAISQSAERLAAELQQGMTYKEARKAATNAAMIPTINSLFAVGLVSLPGMMTGQILSGVDPLIAVKYQIVVMLMSFTSTGLATILFLILSRSHFCPSTNAPNPEAEQAHSS